MKWDRVWPIKVTGFYLLWPEFSAIYDILREGDANAEIIIVGIGYPESPDTDIGDLRYADYSPSHFPAADEVVEPPQGLASGQGPNFLLTLQEDIIPFVEMNYRTNSHRGLGGHSIAGTFAAHVMFERPEMFSSYLLWPEFSAFERRND